MSWRARIRMQLGTLDLDVDIEGGDEPIALVGPNGSGKTTLLRTMAGAHHPAAGRIEVQGQLLFDSDRDLHVPPEERRVGYVPQGYGLFPHLRVVDNVAFGGIPATASRDDRRAAARDLLDRLDGGHLADRYPAELSGGEQQRIALARTLMIDPRILLLDEPLAALDASARRSMRGTLAEHLARRATPAIVVTHDVRDVLALDATVVALDRGRVAQRGTVRELADDPANEFLAEFFAAGIG